MLTFVSNQGSSPTPVHTRNSDSVLESYIQSLQEHDEEELENSTHESDLEPDPDTSSMISGVAVTATEHSDEIPTLSCIPADQSTMTDERRAWTESKFCKGSSL